MFEVLNNAAVLCRGGKHEDQLQQTLLESQEAEEQDNEEDDETEALIR